MMKREGFAESSGAVKRSVVTALTARKSARALATVGKRDREIENLARTGRAAKRAASAAAAAEAAAAAAHPVKVCFSEQSYWQVTVLLSV